MLWRSKVEPTGFKIYVADPVEGQVAEQARRMIQGRNALVVGRLKVDRGKIQEIEQLYARNINDAAVPLLTTPVPASFFSFPTPFIPLLPWRVKHYFICVVFSKGPREHVDLPLWRGNSVTRVETSNAKRHSPVAKIVRLDSPSKATNRDLLELIGTTFGVFRMPTT